MKSRLLLTITALVAACSPVDETLTPYASTEDAVRLPDGRLLNFVCMGEGSPTVILTAGMGNAAFEGWAMVQPAMAESTRVCAWDRPGFGLSDGTTTPMDVAVTTTDLEAALDTGEIPGPYVMVGHSLGAYESLLFTDRQPDKVVGMVLVDPSIPNQTALLHEAQPGRRDLGFARNRMVQIYSECAADIRAGTAKVGGPDLHPCFAFPPDWPPALKEALAAKLSNPVHYATMASFAASGAVDATLAINPSRNYRNMPLIVLSAGDRLRPPPGAPPPPEEVKARGAVADMVADRGHAQLAALSTRGVNTRVPGANHYIQRSQPQAVIDAVAEVVSQARSASR